MRLGVYSLTLFFVCLNISLFMIDSAQILGEYAQPPYENPEGIISKLIHTDTLGKFLFVGIIPISVGGIIYFITGKFIYGGTVAIILFALDFALPVFRWVLFGFPIFLTTLGTPLWITTSITALMAVVWFFFILSFLSQRQLRD